MATEEIMLIRGSAGTVLQTVSEVTYTDTLDIPQHKTAAQYAVEDHIIQNPISVQLKLTILKDDLQDLLDLKEKKERLKFISETRMIESVAIAALNHTEGESENTCNLTLKLQEVIVARVETASESLDILQARAEGSISASNASASPEDYIDTEDIVEIGEAMYLIEGLAG